MTALIIDDEAHAVATLRNLLAEHCPQVEVVATASDVESGLRAVDLHQPDLIFLDVIMPRATGFDLVRELPKVNSPEIIFVTSFDSYALEAIKVCALAYIVKPINVSELINGVALAQQRIGQRISYERTRELLRNINNPRSATNRIGIPSERGLEFVETGNIIRCEGLDGATRIVMKESKDFLSSYNLGEFRKLLEAYNFYAPHKSHLVNLDQIVRYDKDGTILMSDEAVIPVSRRRRQDFLEQMTRL
ncbi:DNA-binding response regulator [Lewinellaceae bacterium SD302]|nr:DNA-binding response regulator [Lewinellaceae bacterium SD302]